MSNSFRTSKTLAAILLGVFVAFGLSAGVSVHKVSAAGCLLLTNYLEKGDDDSVAADQTYGEVAQLQHFLVDQGVLTTSTFGTFGPVTFNAVKAFQAQQNVRQTGSVGPLTRYAVAVGSLCGGLDPSTVNPQTATYETTAILAASVTPTLTCTSLQNDLNQGSDDKVIREIYGGMDGTTLVSTINLNGEVQKLQEFLVTKGYLDTTIYGYYGNATRNAVVALQTQYGISPTGVVGPLTRQFVSALSGCVQVVAGATVAHPSGVSATCDTTNNNTITINGTGIALSGAKYPIRVNDITANPAFEAAASNVCLSGVHNGDYCIDTGTGFPQTVQGTANHRYSIWVHTLYSGVVSDAVFTSASCVPTSGTTVAPNVTNFVATPSTITVGQSTSLSWNVTDATNGCTLGGLAVTSPTTTSPIRNTTYTLTCTGSGGSRSKTVNVTVNPLCHSEQTLINGVCRDNTISYTCSSGVVIQVPANLDSSQYAPLCPGNTGGTSGPPTCTITVSPKYLTQGQTSLLTWTAPYSTGGYITGFGPLTSRTGVVTFAPTLSETFRGTFWNPAGTTTCSDYVVVYAKGTGVIGGILGGAIPTSPTSCQTPTVCPSGSNLESGNLSDMCVNYDGVTPVAPTSCGCGLVVVNDQCISVPSGCIAHEGVLVCQAACSGQWTTDANGYDYCQDNSCPSGSYLINDVTGELCKYPDGTTVAPNTTNPDGTTNPAVTTNPTTPSDPGGLVPCTGLNCNLCSFAELIKRIITFLLMIAVPIAMGLFAYAGFLYFTAGANPSNIEKAHKVFRSTFIGFLIALSGWLLVETVINVLVVGQDFSSWSWNSLQCNATRPMGGQGDITNWLSKAFWVTTPTPTGDVGVVTNDAVAFRLSAYGVTEKNSTVSVSGLQGSTVNGLIALAQSCCAYVSGNPQINTIMITSGTDGTHSETGPYTHVSGYKVDLRTGNTNLDLVLGNSHSTESGTRNDPSGPVLYWVSGNRIAAREGDHWDVLFCPADHPPQGPTCRP